MAHEPLLAEFHRTRTIGARIEKLIICILYLIAEYDRVAGITAQLWVRLIIIHEPANRKYSMSNVVYESNALIDKWKQVDHILQMLDSEYLFHFLMHISIQTSIYEFWL